MTTPQQTPEEYEQLFKRTKERVSKYLDVNGAFCLVPYDIRISDERRNHVIECGASIMLHKWKMNPHPGPFDEAIVNDKLSDAIGRADDTNRHMLIFYATMVYNMGFNER